MPVLHAANLEELRTIEGTPTECDEIVPDAAITAAARDVTCPGCRAVVSAKSAGDRARRAISIGQSSGLFRDAAIERVTKGADDG